MHWPWIYHYPISAINNRIFLLANSCIIQLFFNLTLSREKILSDHHRSAQNEDPSTQYLEIMVSR